MITSEKIVLLETALEFGSEHHKHAHRLLEDGNLSRALEHAQQAYDRLTAALPLLTEEAANDATGRGCAMVRLRPNDQGVFEAAIMDDGEWRVFASGPYTELVKAVGRLGYSASKLEERFIVPYPRANITHYVFLEPLSECNHQPDTHHA